MLDDGTLAALHRRALGHRPDLEPDDLRQGDRPAATPTTSRSRELREQGLERRGAVLRARARPTCSAPRSCSRRSTSAPTASTAGSRSRSRRCSPTTPSDDRPGARTSTRAPPCNIFIKIPGTEAGLHGDRGVDLRRRPGQRHAAVLEPSSTSPRPRPTCAGSSAAIEAGLEPDVAVGRLAVHQPLGRGGGRRGARRAAQPARDRGRQADLPAYRELLDSDRWQRLAERGRAPAAAAVGQHRDQGPRRVRRALRRGARRAVHDQHDAREDAARVRRPRRGRRAAARGRRRRRAGRWRASPTPASTSTRSRRSSRRRAPRRSSSRGRSCSRRSPPKGEKLAAAAEQ